MPKKYSENLNIGEVLMSWSFKENNKIKAPFALYVFSVIVIVFFVVYGIFTNNFLFILIILLFVLVVFLQNFKPSRQILFTLTDIGVLLNTKFFDYDEFSEFYIVFLTDTEKILYLQPKNPILPILKIPLSVKEDANQVRSILEKYIEENFDKEKEESVIDMISRKIGF